MERMGYGVPKLPLTLSTTAATVLGLRVHNAHPP